MSAPLNVTTGPTVARIRAELAGRIASSALAAAAPRGAAPRQPLDTEAAVALLRRASAGWLRDNVDVWRPLLAAAVPAAGGPQTAAPEAAARLDARALDIVRAVVAEIAAVLQSGIGNDAARKAIARAVARLTGELERWPALARETRPEARAPAADSAPTWPPFSPYATPGPRRVRRRAPRRAPHDDEAVDDTHGSPGDDTPPQRDTAGRRPARDDAHLLDIVRWLERHDGRADYGWLAGTGSYAPTGRVVDDSA